MEKKINEKAVANFLSTMDMSLSRQDHLNCLIQDTRAYKWNTMTGTAIMCGIEKAYDKNQKVG